MKTLLAAVATIAILAGAGPVSAQMNPPTKAPHHARHHPSYVSDTPSWMQDDHSSSDHPIRMRGDISGERLNSQYLGGIDVPPGQGLPAEPAQR
jgi:hypothetical protein